MKVTNNFLDESDDLIFDLSTPNHKGEFQNGLPDTLVIHFTAGASAESSAKHLCKPASKASAHLVIGRNGEIYQLAPFNIVTWHAGKSSWNGRTGLNQYSIGIELDNAGQLSKNENGIYKTWFEKKIDPEDVFKGTHRNQSEITYWHAYTEKQINRVFEVCETLVEHYSISEIVGHEEISPSRKTDPGPAFPLDKLRNSLTVDARNIDGASEIALEQNVALVNADKLNIRSGPGADFPLIAEPLSGGETVKIVDSNNGWLQVEKTTKGWVSEKYLKR